MASKFRSFMLQTQHYKPLSLISSSKKTQTTARTTSASSQLIMMLELSCESRYDGSCIEPQLLETILRTIHAPGCLAPIFIILSASTEEGCRDRFQVESALGMDLVSSPQCRIVHCNGIPKTKLKKALKHIVGSEGYGGEDIDRGIEDIIISARGDLRHAITEMQFFCSSFQRAPKALLKRTRKSGKRKKKDESTGKHPPRNE